MAQTSGLWTTAGAPAGHQVVSYTEVLASDMLAIAAACSGFEGVAQGYLNELAPSTTGNNNCRIATGGAMVDGKYYKNSANVDLTIDSPSAGHYRIDRVVIEATWATPNVVATVIKNGVEDAVAPAYPSTAGVNYAITIAQVRVNEGGVIAYVTDERLWAIVDTDGSTLEANAGELRVKDGGITAAKIANRTRAFLVPCTGVTTQLSGGVDAWRNELAGFEIDVTSIFVAFGEFAVPSDFYSAMTVKAVYQPGATGNVYTKQEARYGAAGEAYSIHTANDGGYAAVGVTNLQLSIVQSVSIANAALGDIVTMAWYRDGTNGSDTVEAYIYFKGWLVEYTADS